MAIRLMTNRGHLIVVVLLSLFALSLAAGAPAAFAQCPVESDAATYPMQPLTYPMTSNRYARPIQGRRRALDGCSSG
jgi:hypothetical protein